MNNIPDFEQTELEVIHSALQKRYGRDVDLELADSEVKLDPATPALTLCPTVYWKVNEISLVILKTDSSRYRGQFFYSDLEFHGTGVSEYANLSDCVMGLLRAQADHDLDRKLYG